MASRQRKLWAFDPASSCMGLEQTRQLAQRWVQPSDAASRLRAATGGRPFGLVLIDWQLPGLRESALTTSLTTGPDFEVTQVILLAPLGKVGILANRRAGTRTIARPVRPAQLYEALLEAASATPSRPRLQSESLEPCRAPDTSKPTRLLVAEDNPVNQKVIRSHLTKLGYEVDLVGDGDAAVRAALSDSYAALFMDCQMPDTDGFEATIRLRQQLPTHPPIIALTASVLDSDRERCRQVGMDDFLAKPIDRAALAEILARWLPPALTVTPSPCE